MQTQDDPISSGRAISLSIVLHLLALALFAPVLAPALGIDRVTSDAPVRTARLTIEHRVAAVQRKSGRRPQQRIVAVAARSGAAMGPGIAVGRGSAPRVRTFISGSTRIASIRSVAAVRRSLSEAVLANAGSEPRGGRPIGSAARTVRDAFVATEAVAVTTAPPDAQTSTPAPEPVAVAAAMPSANPQVVATAAPGGWAQDYPARLMEPSLLSALQTMLGKHQHIRVSVGEDGRATEIVFVTRVVDADVRAEIERRLLQSRYLPAECSGMHCNGTVDLRT